MKARQFPALLGGRPVSKYEDTPTATIARLLRAKPKHIKNLNLNPMQAALLTAIKKGESK